MADSISGVIEVQKNGDGFLRNVARSFQVEKSDPYVPARLVSANALVTGALVTGPSTRGKRGERLSEVKSVNGLAVDAWRGRTQFKRLQAINPENRFRLGKGGNVTMRLVELFAPVGRGTRGLIVSPPKAGKTRILEELAIAIHEDAPDTRVVAVLVDERPEEVTHFHRRVPAEVLASSSDQSIDEHVRLATMCMAQVRCELECGHDVVLLVDSITRLSRAFNHRRSNSGRTMTGGLDSRALEVPRQFFGMARNVENGGSVTVLATALVETGSRLDDLIFEEFKGTGNSEIVLSRALAEKRVFPAIDLPATGTRREELLYTAEEIGAINRLRRHAMNLQPDQAIDWMLKLFSEHPTNEALLAGVD